MALAESIAYAAIDELCLDPTNPRLGRAHAGQSVAQERVKELMREWALEELAVSFLESGFWPQEALITVRESLYGPPPKLVVVEGNRRLAALLFLRDASHGRPVSRSWKTIAADRVIPEKLFSKVPHIIADSREDVTAFLGFRHVTGIKEWGPAQKAEYIARLVDDDHMSYEEVRRKIGSRLDAVRRNYIAHRIFLQMEGMEDQLSVEQVESRFSVLFLSLREHSVQEFLGVDIAARPEDARIPVPTEKLSDLADFSVWLFGTDSKPPLFSDSRHVSDFSRILASPEAVDYLRTTPGPSFDIALQKAGVEVTEVLSHIKQATDHVELALSRVHLHTGSLDLRNAVKRFGLDARELIGKFPDIAKQIFANEDSGE